MADNSIKNITKDLFDISSKIAINSVDQAKASEQCIKEIMKVIEEIEQKCQNESESYHLPLRTFPRQRNFSNEMEILRKTLDDRRK